ncbi:hypothetical protein HMI54_008714 [Coelomomyces lativittatus]|nr:hypothetical protein HMI54_008714 [Coelomomyces lativittatus]
MTASPLPAVLKIRKEQNLGETNPLPFAFIIVNSLVWIEFGNIVLKNAFVTVPNILCIIFGLFYVFTVYGLSTPRQQLFMNLVGIGLSCVIYLSSMICTMVLKDTDVPDSRSFTMMGILSVIILSMFYTSPLSVLWKVLKSRNSIYFNLPLAITALANGSFWAGYGFYEGNPYIWGPNLVGATFAVLQIICRLIFRARPIEVLPQQAFKSSTSDSALYSSSKA